MKLHCCECGADYPDKLASDIMLRKELCFECLTEHYREKFGKFDKQRDKQK